MNQPTAPAQIPAERVRPGTARQVVNAYDRDGRFLRQVAYRGTERQARAYAERQTLHDTHPRYAELTAVLRGEK